MEPIKIKAIGNPAIQFAPIIKRIEEYSKTNGITIEETINSLISDLQNINSKDYTKKVESIEILGATQKTIGSLIKYLRKVENTYKDNTKVQRKKEERKKIKEAKKQEEIKKAEEDTKRKIEEIWKSIEETVKKDIDSNNIGSASKCWLAVRNSFKEQAKSKEYQKVKTQIFNMLDTKIEEEKDKEYFEEVKYFKRNFSFLKDLPEIADATMGISNRKFKNLESYERYCNLREQLQTGWQGEFKIIEELLKSEGTPETDKKILEARLQVIKKEKEKINEER